MTGEYLIDGQTIAQRLREFDARHGDSIMHGAWIYFEDGAAREKNPIGLMQDAPTDAYDRAKSIRWFWKMKLDEAIRDFDRKRAQLHNEIIAAQNDGYSPPHTPADVVRMLKPLKENVLRTKKQSDIAEAEVRRFQPAHIAAADRMRAVAEADCREALSALQEIKI